MTMSGPVPVLAATADCWRMSSQPTKSTRVSIPVVSWNLAVLARNRVSSGSTKRAGLRMRSLASFSKGKLGAATSARGICAPASLANASAAVPPTVNRSASRRVMMLAMGVPPLALIFRSRASEAQAGRLVEQMDVGPIRGDVQRLAGPRRDALAESGGDRTLADAQLDLRLGARRLDQHDASRHALLIEPQMLGADAVEDRRLGRRGPA